MDIFRARQWQPLHHAKLGMGMEISNYLKAVKPRQNRFDLLVAAVMGDNTLWLPKRCLKAKGMLNDEPVLKLISE